MLPSGIQNGIDVAARIDVVADETGVVAWVHRVMRKLPVHRSSKRVLRHVETLSLGAKRAVHLIECDGQQFLLCDGFSSPVPLTQRFAAEERH